MTIPPLFSSMISKRLLVFYLSLFLAACSTEENLNGSDGTGLSSVVGIEEVTLTWVAPVEREDGTPISMSEIAGYRVYFGTSAGSYTNEVDIADKDTMQVTLSSLASGTYYIVVTTYDSNGLESSYSPEVIASV